MWRTNWSRLEGLLHRKSPDEPESGSEETRPPATFQVSESAFDPAKLFTPTPGMVERVQQLSGAGRFRTALGEVLAILSRDPHNQEALYYANLIVGMHSRTTHLQAVEPLSNRYLWDSRLDPIFAVCSRCKSPWAPGRTPVELLFEKVAVTNPIGMQCGNCGYVLCRKCLSFEHVGVDLSIVSNSCPNCRKPALSAVVHPTGRPPMQLPRRQAPVKAVLVYRQGPIPPDREYMEHLLDARSPDALDDGAQLIGCPVPAWPADSEELVRSAMVRFVVMRPDVEAGEMRDDLGQRVYLVKSFAVGLPQKTPAAQPGVEAEILQYEDRITELETALHVLPKSGTKVMGLLVVSHFRRLLEKYLGDPMLGRAVPEWMVLASSGVFDWTCGALDETLRAALQSGTQQTRTHRTGAVEIIATAIPAVQPETVRRYFDKGYLAFLEMQGFLTRQKNSWVSSGSGSLPSE